MSRLGKAISILLLLVAARAHGADRFDTAADDALSLYLERAQLYELLAGHLEDRLSRDPAPDRTELAEKLSRTYAELHTRATTIEDQNRWRQKGLDLLERVPDVDSIELRLGFARASYTRLERLAEQSLLRLEEALPREGLVDSLIALLDTLEQIVARSEHRISRYERQLDAARATDTRIIDKALAEHQRLRSQASYLAGYTALYIARLSPDPSASASRSIRHFATVLNLRDKQPLRPADLATNLLEYDHVARAALGIALASALKPDPAAAEAWFDRLGTSPDVSEPVAAELPIARIRAFASIGRWRAALDATIARGNEPLGALDARRLAVLLFERGSPGVDDSAREALIQRVLSELIAQSETGHVLQIVSGYDITGINPDGFVGTYVRALKRYETARSAHRAAAGDASSPTGSVELAAEYARAGDEFANALRTDDASAYPGAVGSVRMLSGLSYFYAGPRRRNMQNASDQFRHASDAFREEDPDRAASALWMAITSLDTQLERVGPDADVTASHDELLTLFLTRYPEHPRAHAVTYKRATSDERDPERAIDELLRIPPTSSLHPAARRQAVRLLYDALQKDGGSADPWRRSLFLDLTERILEEDLREALPRGGVAGDPVAANRAALHARRLFEISIGAIPREDERAERALDALASIVSLGILDIDGLEAELHYSRAKLLASRGDLAAAREESDKAGVLDERFESAGSQLFFRESAVAWRGAREAPLDERTPLARRVVEAGRPVLRELVDAAGEIELSKPGSTSIVATIAEASAEVWESTRETEMRDFAHLLYRVLARSAPRTVAYILPAARLETAMGAPERALPYWRTILAASTPLTDEWIEAKHGVIAAHERSDPARAREILQQFDLLHPAFEHPVWSPKFDALRRALAEASP